VTLLATSRERLRLRAERISALDGMVTEIDGVALFALNAQAVQPAFALDATTRPQMTAICRRLGGMPLAIELAAGWADTLSLAEIATELAQGDELLVSQAADLVPRHRSVRAVCDATWARLTLQEQAVFAEAAIFRGGGTRVALQAVTGASLGSCTPWWARRCCATTPSASAIPSTSYSASTPSSGWAPTRRPSRAPTRATRPTTWRSWLPARSS
jgi:predicted ATPase